VAFEGLRGLLGWLLYQRFYAIIIIIVSLLNTSLQVSKRCVQWVALLFVLHLGLGIASPMLSQTPFETICSGTGGIKLIYKAASKAAFTDSVEAKQSSAGGMDCPLCSPVAVALPSSQSTPMTYWVAGHPLVIATQFTFWPVDASLPPLPPRGPPIA
jgi:hypothetical protein